ncbi:chitobiase/beta-hexosaminidase C-terminal domain-containing protein [Prosthecobacter sp.]|uniref:chitobiase/beta-hexosaminidase C-terminal domain-containing protein n=1 Tax=Prosthecobacter sp. TaxID=1965333 RepID=UPI003784369A
MNTRHVRHLLVAAALAWQCAAAEPAALPVNRVRYFPAAGMEQAMAGGKISGSNVSDREGFEPIATIATAPLAGQWSEVTFSNTRLYRWVRYEAPPGSHGEVAELEFYSGQRLLLGKTFGSFGWKGLHNWPRAFDKKTDTYFDSDIADGQFVGVDVGELATAQTPRMDPPANAVKTSGPLDLKLSCNTPGAVIRYAFDGTPGPDSGLVYDKPIHLDRLSTVFAVAFKEGLPPSPVASGTYAAGIAAKAGFHSMHVGNSLTASLLPFPNYARAAGRTHDFHSWLKDGGNTTAIWNNTQTKSKADWDKEIASMPVIDHFSVQPRLPGFTDADLANEANHDALFFELIRTKSPQVQPWIYSEWPSRRPGFNGWVPPFTTYEEACAALMMSTETIQTKVSEISKAGKRVRILPCTLAVVHLKNRLEQGLIPGLAARDFDPIMFYDNVHPGDAGRYLLCMVWYAAFYGESPVGKMPPVNASLTAEQAAALQQLAWDVVKNYPDCGLYEDGKNECASPQFGSDGKTLTLSSSTPGTWFRYTLDGSTPTRTHGYIYCGKITPQPGIQIKAIAYKSGMADSAVTSP